jgi:hypothetical protein
MGWDIIGAPTLGPVPAMRADGTLAVEQVAREPTEHA